MHFRKTAASGLALAVVALGTVETRCVAQTADRAVPEAAETVTRMDRAVYTPPTQSERLHGYFTGTFNVLSVANSAASAGLSQWFNIPSEWGQGAEGYGRRFASSFGTHIVQTSILYPTSAVLHEDNRYFRSGETGFGRRLKYALLSTFLARHDDGSRHFSISAITSFAGGAAISRAWQPDSTDGPGHALSSFGISIAGQAGFNVAREFFPKILHSRPPVSMSQNASR